MRILSVKKMAPETKADAMGGIEPIEADFFPPGETFDFYNPLDYAREAAYKAAWAAWKAEAGAIQTGTDVANATIATALKVGVGVIALKFLYDYSQKKLKRK